MHLRPVAVVILRLPVEITGVRGFGPGHFHSDRKNRQGRVAQLAEAGDLKSPQCGFEPHHGYLVAELDCRAILLILRTALTLSLQLIQSPNEDVAQLVEQRPFKA